MNTKTEKAMLILDPAPDCCWACQFLIGRDRINGFMCMLTNDWCFNVAEERASNCPLKIFE